MLDSDRAEMNDLIDHLNAVFDEDEKMARVIEDGDHWHGIHVDSATEVAVHIERHNPARTLREVEAIRQVINDYRMSDRACMRSDDPGAPEYATIRAGRDAFASVLRTYATATGWQDNG
jgi:hypothetical protein